MCDINEPKSTTAVDFDISPQLSSKLQSFSKPGPNFQQVREFLAVAGEVNRYIQAVFDDCHEFYDPETRVRALLRQCRIAKAVIQSSRGMIGYLARGKFTCKGGIAFKIQEIIRDMTQNEKSKIYRGHSDPDSLIPKLLEVFRLDVTEMFGGLQHALDMLNFGRIEANYDCADYT